MPRSRSSDARSTGVSSRKSTKQRLYREAEFVATYYEAVGIMNRSANKKADFTHFEAKDFC